MCSDIELERERVGSGTGRLASVTLPRWPRELLMSIMIVPVLMIGHAYLFLVSLGLLLDACLYFITCF